MFVGDISIRVELKRRFRLPIIYIDPCSRMFLKRAVLVSICRPLLFCLGFHEFYLNDFRSLSFGLDEWRVLNE
mgnify:CR=1 FL=1